MSRIISPTITKTLCALLCTLALGVAAADPVDINTATAAELAEAIDGVGLVKAEEIVAYRDKFGPFKSVDDLVLVRGIGAATVDRNRDRLVAQPPPQQQ